MTAAVPAITGVFSPRSENTNIDTTSAGPIRISGVPAAINAAAPALVTATASQGGQRMIGIGSADARPSARSVVIRSGPVSQPSGPAHRAWTLAWRW